MSGEKPKGEGWYVDPTTPGQLRWWNAIEWTDNVQSANAEAQEDKSLEVPHWLTVLDPQDSESGSASTPRSSVKERTRAPAVYSSSAGSTISSPLSWFKRRSKSATPKS